MELEHDRYHYLSIYGDQIDLTSLVYLTGRMGSIWLKQAAIVRISSVRSSQGRGPSIGYGGICPSIGMHFSQMAMQECDSHVLSRLTSVSG